MAVLVNIKNKQRIYLNENGQEVYPPEHPYKGMAKPASERTRDWSLPPKSEAEEKMEIEAQRNALIDDEAQRAIDILKNKGLL